MEVFWVRCSRYCLYLKYFGILYCSYFEFRLLILLIIPILAVFQGFILRNLGAVVYWQHFRVSYFEELRALEVFYSNAVVFPGPILWILGVLAVFGLSVLLYSRYSPCFGHQYCNTLSILAVRNVLDTPSILVSMSYTGNFCIQRCRTIRASLFTPLRTQYAVHWLVKEESSRALSTYPVGCWWSRIALEVRSVGRRNDEKHCFRRESQRGKWGLF